MSETSYDEWASDELTIPQSTTQASSLVVEVSREFYEFCVDYTTLRPGINIEAESAVYQVGILAGIHKPAGWTAGTSFRISKKILDYITASAASIAAIDTIIVGHKPLRDGKLSIPAAMWEQVASQ